MILGGPLTYLVIEDEISWNCICPFNHSPVYWFNGISVLNVFISNQTVLLGAQFLQLDH